MSERVRGSAARPRRPDRDRVRAGLLTVTGLGHLRQYLRRHRGHDLGVIALGHLNACDTCFPGGVTNAPSSQSPQSPQSPQSSSG